MVYREFISEVSTFNVDNIVFSKVKEGKQGFKRISLYVKEGNDKSPLYLMMGERFCFGVQPSTDMANKEIINGYQLALPMWDKEAKTEEQHLFHEVMQKIANKCIQHLVTPATKKELKKPGLKAEIIQEKFLPIWHKRDEHMNIDPNMAPTLYIKLQTDRDGDNITITSDFADSDGRRIEPLTLLNSMFKMQRCLIQFHSIYIGSSIKLQLRAIEVEVEQKRKRTVPLMLKPRDSAPVETKEDYEEEEEEEEEDQVEDQVEEEKSYTAPKFQEFVEASVVTSPSAPVLASAQSSPVEVKRRRQRRVL